MPPLNYPFVYRLKQDFPQLNIVINGGITSLTVAERHLSTLDGVMIGRAIYQQPFLLAQADERFYHHRQHQALSRAAVVREFLSYMAAKHRLGVPIKAMTRHILGLYHGQMRAKQFRTMLSVGAVELAALNSWLTRQECLTDAA